MARKNIFLDFFNRDSRQIYGLYDKLNTKQHIQVLVEALNVAVFLCGERCILPPGFALECFIARTVLNRYRRYLQSRLVVFSMRENSISQLADKKHVQYSPYSHLYAELYNDSAFEFIGNFPLAVIFRRCHIADSIGDLWINAPDSYGEWQSIKRVMSATQVRELVKVPARLREMEVAVAWPGFVGEVKNISDEEFRLIRNELQHTYFSIYIREYECTVLRDVPFMVHDFSLKAVNLSYSFSTLQHILEHLQLWNRLVSIDPDVLIELRKRPGYVGFIDQYERICKMAATPREFEVLSSRFIREFMSISNKVRSRLVVYDFRQPVKVDSVVEEYDESLNDAAGVMSRIEETDLLASTSLAVRKYSFSEVTEVNPRYAFIVHGRDKVARDSLYEFLRSVDLKPLEWNHVVKHLGKGTPQVLEVIDHGMEMAQSIVVLFTADEDASLSQRLSERGVVIKDEGSQPRPNVLIEAGIAMSRYPNRHVIVSIGEIRAISDMAGLHVVHLDNSAEKRNDLLTKLETCGCTIDKHGNDWLTAGDF